MNYYEHHLGDYAKDTVHLTMVEDGAYRRLIDVYYVKELPLPAEESKIFKLARASTKQEKDAVRSILDEFFSQSPDGWHHKRCDQEIERYQLSQEGADDKRENDKERQRRARERRKALFAELRGHDIVPAWDTKTAELEAMLSRVTHRDSSAPVTPPVTRDNTATQSPVPRHQKKEEAELPLDFVLPDWMPTEAWDGYVAMRKKQRKPMTDRARDLKVAELQRFRDEGYDIEAILDKSTANSWTDIYAPKDGSTSPTMNGGGNRV